MKSFNQEWMDMAGTFDDILDDCIQRIQQGATIEECIARHPEHAVDLEPALRAFSQVLAASTFTPSHVAKAAARQRFSAAREERQRRREQRSRLASLFYRRPTAWVATAAVLLVVIAGYFGLKPALFPKEPVSPTENFAFLISDEANAIGDFQALDITITSIGLLQGDEAGQWLELEPQVGQVDLTLLQGENAQAVWRGNVPEGLYSKVFIYVGDVQGVLKESGATVDIKLPSQKLHINSTFEVSADSTVNFIYDLTVIARGNAQSGVRYLLQPQADQSGAGQKFKEVPRKGRKT